MTTGSFTIAAEVTLGRQEAFERTVDELGLALSGSPLALRAGPHGGLSEGGTALATVTAWEPPERILLAWRSSDWGERTDGEVELRFEPTDVGTRLVFAHRGFGAPMLSSGEPPDSARELLGWFVGALITPAVRATTPGELGRWLTDRRARRPAGTRARASYRAPEAHQLGFDATLEALGLSTEDRLLEVGCGGGAFMAQALASGCRAVAVDHSEDMVRLTAETNAAAVADGRLEAALADAARLPLADATFTAAAMTHVFFFLTEPVAALAECRRVLAPGGRLVVYTSSACLAGTPAAPEPMVRYMRFYEPEVLRGMALEAGFGRAKVADLGGAQLLTAIA